MTTAQSLSRIERVELRNMWANEAADFTPWLAENLSQLGEALGMDMELEEREAPVGGYSLDILAKEVGSNRPVIIENQLEATDHNHLGQLLTYATGYDANVIVWIAKDFRDEHRAALDWLNERTGDETSFFGIAVELWKIDDSRPAVNFNLISTPNEWRREGANAVMVSSRGASERSERYRAFWQSIIDPLREDHNFTYSRVGQRTNWFGFPSGYGDRIRFRAIFSSQGSARIEVYIDSTDEDWNTNLFDELEIRKESIESGLSDSLNWERSDQFRYCRIASIREGSIDDTPETLENIRNWMIDRLLAFKRVFGPHLEKLVG